MYTDLSALTAIITRPSGPDLWAFWLLAGLWVVIFGLVWGMIRWLRGSSDDDVHRGL